MSEQLPIGPYRVVKLPDGAECSWYIIPYDKEGVCTGPQTLEHLLQAAATGGYSDIFLFSHGWNNDWKTAAGRYEHFLRGFMEMRQKHSLQMRPGYKPLLAGVFWPSIALTTEDEQAPSIAGTGDPAIQFDDRIALERAEISELATALDPAVRARFYRLAQQPSLEDAEALEFAQLLQGLRRTDTEEVPQLRPQTAEETVTAWKERESPRDFNDFGTVESGPDAPQAAGLGDVFKKIIPRDIIRAFTVWQMKDRAGTVGARGVSGVLTKLLESSEARLHLIGHSYGAKVVLSALCHPANVSRPVLSILLLQPAISHLCFAERVPDINQPGGYRKALSRVEKPILSTYSRHDVPLTKLFHLALRRASDKGEIKIAAAGDPPNIYAALGGFGPRGCGERLMDIKDAQQKYDFENSASKVYGLNASRTIGGHGAVSNESTWWALYTVASG